MRPSIREKVMNGQATDAELEEYFGQDLINAGMHQIRGKEASRRVFTEWYKSVIKPIQLKPQPAYQMFIGETSIEEYANSLTEDEAERFVKMFPGLQSEYQKKIDNGEILT